MRIEELLKEAKKQLLKNEVEDASLIARVLLQLALKMDRNEIISKQTEEVNKEKEKQYKKTIEKIIEGIPLQYITNTQEFMKLKFYVDENVLIPQPDTEILVEEVLKIAKKENKEKILDICAGSGCIGISLAYYLENAKVTMSDISKNAIDIAKKNSKNNKVVERTSFIKSDLFENIKEKFDIIVSNPPYIETNIIKTLSKQVQNEPTVALDGGEDGLLFYKKIIEKAPYFLNNNGYLCMEIGYDQKEKVIELVKKENAFLKIEAKQDLAGNDRIIICQKSVPLGTDVPLGNVPKGT